MQKQKPQIAVSGVIWALALLVAILLPSVSVARTQSTYWDRLPEFFVGKDDGSTMFPYFGDEAGPFPAEIKVFRSNPQPQYCFTDGDCGYVFMRSDMTVEDSGYPVTKPVYEMFRHTPDEGWQFLPGSTALAIGGNIDLINEFQTDPYSAVNSDAWQKESWPTELKTWADVKSYGQDVTQTNYSSQTAEPEPLGPVRW